MNRSTHAGRFGTLALVALLIAGCGGGADVELAPVEGTVTVGGSPAEGVEVEFQPTAEEASPSYGTTDAAGKYEMMFSEANDGVQPGEHNVTITVTQADGSKSATYEKATVEPAGGTFDYTVP